MVTVPRTDINQTAEQTADAISKFTESIAILEKIDRKALGPEALVKLDEDIARFRLAKQVAEAHLRKVSH